MIGNMLDQWLGYNAMVRDKQLVEEAKRANDLKERKVRALERLADLKEKEHASSS